MPHSTNYFNTLIEIAEDSKRQESEIPKIKGDKKSVALLQFEKISKSPYRFTSDEVLFDVFIQRKEIAEGSKFSKSQLQEKKEIFFSKGQPCFRASPLTKSYGFGAHSNEEGKMAIFGAQTKEYKALLKNKDVKKIKAMRSKRK